MATLAGQIDANGITIPSYEDAFAQFQLFYKSIYGADIDLDPSTQDGQWLAIQARAVTDLNLLAVGIYNSFSPATAVGAGLSSVVKINGLQRLVATNSTAIVAIGGTAGTTINNGVVADPNIGVQWTLPPVVVIPNAGTINVTATCSDLGAAAAAAGTLTKIVTPTRGWQTVTNAAAATPGNPVETDAALRRRQSESVTLPAKALTESIFAEVANVPGVARAQVYLNDTDSTDGRGLVAHSVAVVTQGGDNAATAAAIFDKKTPGTATNGTITVTVVDQNGVTDDIKFYPLTVVPLSVAITVQAQTGYTDAIGSALKQAIVDFVNGLDIGETSYLARLYSPANSGGTGPGATYVVTVLQQAKKPAAPSAADVAINFHEAASLALADVALTVI